MTRVLVAGSTGYLGGYVVRELARRGSAIRALTRSPEKLQTIAGAIDEIATTRQIDLPRVDEGMVNMNITGDPGMQLEEMDNAVDRIEDLLLADQHVETLFTTAGGFVFGRSQHEASNRASIQVRLKPLAERGGLSSKAWIGRINQRLELDPLAGVKISLRAQGLLDQLVDFGIPLFPCPELQSQQELPFRLGGPAGGLATSRLARGHAARAAGARHQAQPWRRRADQRQAAAARPGFSTTQVGGAGLFDHAALRSVITI